MKKLTALGLTFAALLFVAVAFAAMAVTPARADGDTPCDPTFQIVRWCTLHGGHFDYAACKCVF